MHQTDLEANLRDKYHVGARAWGCAHGGGRGGPAMWESVNQDNGEEHVLATPGSSRQAPGGPSPQVRVPDSITVPGPQAGCLRGAKGIKRGSRDPHIPSLWEHELCVGMYRQPTPEAGAPSALGVPRQVPNGGPKAPGCGCGPGGTGRGWPAWKSWDEPGHGENQRWGPAERPWGTHRSGAQSQGSRRLSQPGPGLLVEGEINHLLRRAPPATCPARCSSHSSQPHQRDQRRGPERFSSRSALAAIFEKGTCPRLGGASAFILFGPVCVVFFFLVEFSRPPYLKSCQGRSQRGWSIREG